ncbi:hypothetical protein Ccr2_gp021 [Caulobacter phage Ccr2]|nr:hypothetical protein Ccr10_gp022 [Caulobacter phage Ccr10]ARB13896.1 hypothetical protein Ccr2_gp021 [Caulobacter phage Ccr2]ARB14585.1 hypothetical protein Ccr29_gp028 [Caulobacter phage Ccr29]
MTDDIAAATPLTKFQPYDWRGYIEFPATLDLAKLVQAVYARSVPKGLGFLHFAPGDLDEGRVTTAIYDAQERFTEAEAQSALDFNGEPRDSRHRFFDFDYVDGRAVKFNLYRDLNDRRFYSELDWYDHSEYDVFDLVATLRDLSDADTKAYLDAVAAAKAQKKADEFAATEARALLLVRALKNVMGGSETIPREEFYRRYGGKPSVMYAADAQDRPYFDYAFNRDHTIVTVRPDEGGETLYARDAVPA